MESRPCRGAHRAFCAPTRCAKKRAWKRAREEMAGAGRYALRFRREEGCRAQAGRAGGNWIGKTTSTPVYFAGHAALSLGTAARHGPATALDSGELNPHRRHARLGRRGWAAGSPTTSTNASRSPRGHLDSHAASSATIAIGGARSNVERTTLARSAHDASASSPWGAERSGTSPRFNLAVQRAVELCRRSRRRRARA